MSLYSTVIYEIVTLALGVIVILLNILEAVLIKKSKQNSKGNIYLMSLAVSDVLAGVGMVVLKTMYQFMKTDLKENLIAVEVYHVLRHAFIRFSLLVSIFNLLAIAIDRYIAIAHSMFHLKNGATFQRTMCFTTWMISVACVTTSYCVTRFGLADVERYNNLIFPVSTYLSAVLLVSLYSMIFKAISNSRKISTANTASSRGTKSAKQSEIRFFKIAVKTVVAFLICWLPFSTCKLLKAIGVTCGGEEVDRTLFMLAYANSILNPFIYFLHGHVSTIKNMFKSRLTKKHYVGNPGDVGNNRSVTTMETSFDSISKSCQYRL